MTKSGAESAPHYGTRGSCPDSYHTQATPTDEHLLCRQIPLAHAAKFRKPTEYRVGINISKDKRLRRHWLYFKPLSTESFHYIRVDLGKKVKGVSFWYKGRDNGNNDNPKKMTILASNNVGDNPDAAGAWEIGKLGSDVLPSGRAPEYTSPGLFSETEFQYLWLKIEEAYSGSNWIAMAELTVKEMTRSIYDPENEPIK